jgi:CheY-like chemotaxis protein
MDHGSGAPLACPYCRRGLQWVPKRWFGRGAYVCSYCGEFPDLTGAGRGAPAAAPGASPAPPDLREPHDDRPRVLLVDDSAEIRDLYALMLEQTAAVITTSSGEQALTIACTHRLDAIVLDVIMPGMDGWRTCERLKANPLTSGIPVIMLTSWDGPDVPERAERAGASAVLIKPCPLERLIIAIENAVQRRFGGPRRWTRKSVGRALPALVDNLPAHVLNLSYGGICVEVDRLPPALPSSFEIAVPTALVSLKADAVWVTRALEETWLCGAEIPAATDEWRGVVDAVT